jgi:hypothetical protein
MQFIVFNGLLWAAATVSFLSEAFHEPRCLERARRGQSCFAIAMVPGLGSLQRWRSDNTAQPLEPCCDPAMGFYLVLIVKRK